MQSLQLGRHVLAVYAIEGEDIDDDDLAARVRRRGASVDPVVRGEHRREIRCRAAGGGGAQSERCEEGDEGDAFHTGCLSESGTMMERPAVMRRPLRASSAISAETVSRVLPTSEARSACVSRIVSRVPRDSGSP